MVSATRLTEAEEISCFSALFIRRRARTSRSGLPLCRRTSRSNQRVKNADARRIS